MDTQGCSSVRWFKQRELGSGAYSKVYKGTLTVDNAVHEVAIKSSLFNNSDYKWSAFNEYVVVIPTNPPS